MANELYLPLPRASLLKAPNQKRSQAMVHAIINAAIAVLARDGYIGFTTHAVAAEAKISTGSLYQYFANKEMLAAAIVERSVLQAEAIMGALFRRLADRPFDEILRQAIALVNRLAAPHKDAIREMLAVAPLLSETGVPALLRRPFLNVASDYFGRNAERYEIVGGYATLVVGVDTLIYMILRRWSELSPMLSDEEYYGAFIAMVTSPIRERRRRQKK